MWQDAAAKKPSCRTVYCFVGFHFFVDQNRSPADSVSIPLPLGQVDPPLLFPFDSSSKVLKILNFEGDAGHANHLWRDALITRRRHTRACGEDPELRPSAASGCLLFVCGFCVHVRALRCARERQLYA